MLFEHENSFGCRKTRTCLPKVVFVTRAEGMRSAAVGYLVLYNLMFILPLVGILAMTYFGVRSETLATLLRRRLAAAKFAMSALFAGLGILVMVTMWSTNLR